MQADYENLTQEELIDLLHQRDREEGEGTRMRYSGQRVPWHIIRQVQPRQQRIDRAVSVGDETAQSRNLILEGENLQAMVSLYKYRGQVDLILTDPPYNTGRDFRYNDKWDTDPNDPDLGSLVAEDDGQRHAKWLRFMAPRIHMMREMLRPNGVLAICIDHREIYRLGMLLDSVFGERNRLGIINWQKSYSPRNDRKHVSTATEYVLVYARNLARATTGLTARTERMDARYSQVDGDPERWKSGDISAMGSSTHPGMIYAVQNPFTGQLHRPPEGRHWSAERKRVKGWLEAWGSKYVDRDLKDGRPKALVIKGAPLPDAPGFSLDHPILIAARKAAENIRDNSPWPEGYWSDRGQGGLSHKRYLSAVKNGFVPTTFWSTEDYDDPLNIEAVSWVHQQSGHSQTGINELTAIMGRNHGFETVKPLKLFKKIISIWCPPDGIVMDPFAGSGTAAHAVLELNADANADRSFVLIEQGRKEKNDPYARTLTAERTRRAISGVRVNKLGKDVQVAEPLPGGFRYQRLTQRVDAGAVLALEREEMIDLLLTSFWSERDRGASHLQRLPAGENKYLFAEGLRGEGYFLVWSGPEEVSNVNQAAYQAIADEAEKANLKPPFHVFARRATYPGPAIEFYKIPNRILERMGFNEAVDAFSGSTATDKQDS